MKVDRICIYILTQFIFIAVKFLDIVCGNRHNNLLIGKNQHLH